MYCINIRTPTNVGFGYDLGTWGEANVNNVGFVARLLNTYFPNGALPPIGVNGVNNTADQAAAVQSAIWYFSDNYVVAANNPLLAAVAGIVNDVRLAGPLPAPAPPTLQITSPSTTTGEAGGAAIGPYVVHTSDVAGAEVTATGATMFADAGATVPIANGTLVPGPTQIWLQSTTVGSATLTAVAEAEVPSGNVYLYNGNINGVNDAQKLILAQTTTVTANAQATAAFTQPTTTTTTTVAPTTTEPESTTTEPESTTTAPGSTTTTGTTTTVATTTTAASPTSLAATTTVAGSSLPGTGRNPHPGTAAGLLLVGAGLLTMAAGRARRLSH
jgi:hypothetical protein